MASPTDRKQNTDPLKLVREGTSQEQRFFAALAPSHAPVNERRPEHGMVFAQAYAEFLKYYDASNIAIDNWTRFFSQDVSVQLAVAATQDVEYYKSSMKSYFDFLHNLGNQNGQDAELKKRLGYLFSCAGTLARQLDRLKEELPPELSFKGALQNLIRSQLAPGFRRLLAYYNADFSLAAANRLIEKAQPDIVILGTTTISFSDVISQGLSKDWITNKEGKWVAANPVDWNTYVTTIPADASVYGAGGVFARTNHIATHNLFTSIFDQFLKVYARVVIEAKQALEATFTNWDRHEPHYALFLAYLRLFEYARAAANTLTGRHLDFYYRDILQLKEKPATPGEAHLLVELAKHVGQHELQSGELFKAGKDELGRDAFFANDRALVANQAKVAALQTIYRHQNNPSETLPFQHDRLFAAPFSNSDDGLGAELTSVDQSWHPFYHKIYQDGALTKIKMPPAEVGFAIASHYLWMAEGARDVTLDFMVSGYSGGVGEEWASNIICAFSGEKGWIEKPPLSFKATSGSNFRLTISLAGDESAITAYNRKVHGFEFETTTPILFIKLTHDISATYAFPIFENVELQQIQLQVSVNNIRNLLLSNDFGLIDASKPFLPFGAQPEAGSALVLGSNEIFIKKNLAYCHLTIRWKNKPSLTSVAYLPWEQYFPSPQVDVYKNLTPWVDVTWLIAGKWDNLTSQTLFTSEKEITLNIKPPMGEFNKQDQPAFQLETPYSINAQTGFVRLALPWGLGHKQYREALTDYLLAVANKITSAIKPTEPYTPEIESLSVSYSAVQTIKFGSNKREEFVSRLAKLYHINPFGHAEQHPYLKTNVPDPAIYFLPQLKHLNVADDKLPKGHPIRHEAEFYIGVIGLKPPQNLALLFQVADGTANPLAIKPDPHIHWSYLRDNEWIRFTNDQVEDHTGGLLNSGIVTFAMPRDASDANTLLPAGMHWIRAAVAAQSDAVCRLRMVAAQALAATFTDKGNAPTFPAQVLPAGTISKLDQPVAPVKKIAQPFATFGGRGAELPTAFYTRVSERLRHKDRAIALWDYERLILAAFPQIYKVKCLNHTRYEPSESGLGIYRELAPGHVTSVTIPNLQFQHLRDPLRPYTSLGLLREIKAFLRQRLACFVKLHVRNPLFEEVHTEFMVRFHEGFDETFYQKKLQEEITRFLSPWAFSGGGSPSFGGKIYQSVLLNFVEERPYVDYVTSFNLFHRYKIQNNEGQEVEVVSPNLAAIEGSKAISMLVSVPPERHLITVIDPRVEEQPHEKCLCEV